MPDTVNPATGETLAHYDEASDADLDAALDRATRAFDAHRATTHAQRADGLRRLADALERDADRLARLATDEMGKPLAQARAEVEKCARACRVYAEHGAAWLADDVRPTEARRSLVAYEPLGVLLAVMPWNFPYWQAVRALAPALAAGNVVVLKHASNVLGCGDALAALVAEAGFADGAMQHVVLSSERIAGVIADDRVAAVTLTGSEGAGRSVGAAAGRALKPCVLELGGSDPFVVLADADVERAAEVGVQARVQNNGQSCIAAKRFVVEAPVADAFAEAFASRMAALRVGDPTTDVDLGPLARRDLRDEVHDQVTRSVRGGARVVTGGDVPDGPGAFYPPTVLADVREGTPAADEEVFGPVAALLVASDEADAVRLANATRFGLGASVWTADLARGERVARQIRAGSVFVNAMVASHPMLPFGGVGESGIGRELGPEGARAFVNVKTLWLDEPTGADAS